MKYLAPRAYALRVRRRSSHSRCRGAASWLPSGGGGEATRTRPAEDVRDVFSALIVLLHARGDLCYFSPVEFLCCTTRSWYIPPYPLYSIFLLMCISYKL
jgi:hypothetical protein